MSLFEDEYAKLNSAQREAVDTIDGPVLVIAGPGTGKTQLLGMRVANILLRTDMRPENILCLTFTNKAANNMRERLGKLVGPPAHGVFVRTFHSFAAELMQLYPDYFWNGAQLTNVPDEVQLDIITGILSELPLDNPLALKFAGKFTVTDDVKEALKLAKEAGLTPDKLRALLDVNLQYIDLVEKDMVEICTPALSYKKLESLRAQVDALRDQNIDEFTRPLTSLSTIIKETLANATAADEGTNKTANTGKWKSGWVQTVSGIKGMHDERKRNAWWLALADVYQTYRDQLHERGYFDYADMIIEVISRLEQEPDMRAAVQEQFQYVLIDEFQDTNNAQMRLAHLVADHYVSEGSPNIMAVGDDDQSIFKFNGAVLSNMLNFRRSYPKAKLVVLTDNYRSTQGVLDLASAVIAQAEGRVVDSEEGISKSLRAMGAIEGPGLIESLSYPTAEHQYYEVAERIKKEFAGTGSVAVLARGHTSLQLLAAQLRRLNVPIRYEQQQNILDDEAVRQIIAVARIVDALAHGDEGTVNQLLPELLMHPLWRIDAETLWHLAIQNRVHPHWLESLLHGTDEELQIIAHWLLWLSGQSVREPLPRMLEYIIGLKASEHLTSPIRQYFLSVSEVDTPYLAALSAVRQLINLAGDFSRQGHATLRDFVGLVDVARDNGRIISDESLFVSAPDAVELYTVHKAKGLEFDSVFVIDAIEGQWKPSNKGRKPPANLPLKPNGDDYNDYVRLMFVALTRAKRNLYISNYSATADGSDVLAAAVIRDALPARVVTGDELQNPVDVLEQTIRWPRLEGSQEKLLLQDILTDFSLSSTALLNFLDVSKGGPQYFLERHLLRLPEGQSTAAAYGTAMHAALERAQRLQSKDAFDLGTVISAYETALASQHILSSEFERYLARGQQVLQRLFEAYTYELPKDGQPEVGFNSVHLGSAVIGGKLDHVWHDQAGGQVIISDYKTGKPLSSFTTRDKNLATKAWRHRRQLQFYALMAQKSGKYAGAGSIQNITGRVVYVDAENQKDLVRQLSVEAEDLARLEKLTDIVWNKITSLNLPDVRHYPEDTNGIAAFEQDLLDGKI